MVSTTRDSIGGPRRPARWRRWTVLLAVAGVGLLAWSWQGLGSWARATSAFDARVACACHYVAGRPLSACKGDLFPGRGPVMLSADEDEKSVTARVLLFASQTARWQEGAGCRLEPWDD